MKRIFLILLIILPLTSCTQSIKFVNFKKGTVIHGEANTITKNVTVNMPNGEILEGKYTELCGGTTSLGSSFVIFDNNVINSLKTQSKRSNTCFDYVLLHSNQSNLMMELVGYSDYLSGHGYGKAKTNDGRNFKVQF